MQGETLFPLPELQSAADEMRVPATGTPRIQLAVRNQVELLDALLTSNVAALLSEGAGGRRIRQARRY